MKPLKLQRLTGADFSEALRRYTDALRTEIENEVEAFPTDKIAQKKRVKRALKDFQYFAETYFPHYFSLAPAPLHEWLFKKSAEVIAERGGHKVAVAAPRAHAKSTITTFALPLWCIVTKSKKYILMLSDTYEQAATLLAAVRAELEANPRLRQDFEKIVGEGRLWREDQIITKNNIKLQPRGSGQKVRGLRHGPHRPDLLLGDDLENDEHVGTLKQRKKLWDWWGRAVRYVGPADGTMDILLVGTILHYDSLLAKLLKSGLWDTKRFQAIVRWPDNMKLWDAFTEIARHDGADKAEAFYRKRKKKMDKGAKVAWAAAQDIASLMLERAEDHANFQCEKQNDPVVGEDAVFHDCLSFYNELPGGLLMFGAVDPSLGGRGTSAGVSDPSAILIGGLEIAEKRIKHMYVVEADIRRRRPQEIIAQVIGYQRKYKCHLWAVEAIQFQEFFRQQLIEDAAAVGVPVPTVPVKPHTDKNLRIQGMQPHVKSELIKFHQSQTTLIEQLEHYPKADHDDGPDALQMLFDLSMSHARAHTDASWGIRTPERTGDEINWDSY